jgi:hypothetical protein
MSPEDAVLPWSRELQNAQLYQPPFLARFEKDGQGLYVVAAYHGCDPRTFRLIDEVFATHQVRLAVVEGWPASGGVNPPMFTGSFKEWLASGFCQGGGESGYTAFHAQEHGASFIGGEPDEQAVVQAVLKQGFTVEDLLGFYFVRQVPQFRREGALETKGLEACFRMLIDGMGKKAGLQEASAHFSLDQFRDWYGKRQGKTFDIATMDRQETAPLASGNFVQRLSSVTGIVRDRFTVDLIATHLAIEKYVLVVYGGSHFATQRPALEALMGKPVEMKPGGN